MNRSSITKGGSRRMVKVVMDHGSRQLIGASWSEEHIVQAKKHEHRV